MGVGRTIDLALRCAVIARGSFMAANDLIGGGTPSPSTTMLYLLRTASFSASERAAIQRGGRHVVGMLSAKATPDASSCTDRRALFCVQALRSWASFSIWRVSSSFGACLRSCCSILALVSRSETAGAELTIAPRGASVSLSRVAARCSRSKRFCLAVTMFSSSESESEPPMRAALTARASSSASSESRCRLSM
eukprot:Amastigsp_a843160_36.p4 type:complete len:194 gc:universal Amastigsp_a843160_36:602-21(-)